MNAVGALILVSVILTVFFTSRRIALLGMMAGVLYLTQGQQITVLGFNLYATRFIELAGFIRVVSKKEFKFRRLNGIDLSLIFLYGFTTIIFLLRSKESQAYQIGVAVDAFLCYFTFRGLITGIDDFRWFLRAFLRLLAPYVVLILFESFTRKNPFAFMGGLEYGDWLREGRLRCQGSFRHASLLGTLGASFLPLYIGLGFSKVDRGRAIFGIVLCMLIVWASNSGGPLNCAAIALVGWALWAVRSKMQLVRRGAIAAIAALAVTMKAPIWYLPAKASALTGGDGWHRSYLMDMAFQNFDKWGLAGMPIQDTWNWFPYGIAVTGGADITNQFLSFGLDSGLLGISLFILLLVVGFVKLGKALRSVRAYDVSRASEPLLWGLGVMLTAHIFNWLGITYFDQTYVIWFMQLAAISSLTEQCIGKSVRGSTEPIDGLLDIRDSFDGDLAGMDTMPRA